MDDRLLIFKEFISSYLDHLPDEDWSRFRQKLTPVAYKKGETVFPATEVCKNVLFITRGLLASEYQEANDPIITRFFKPKGLCSNVMSSINNVLANDRVFTLTNVEGVLFPYTLFLENYLQSNTIGLYFRKWMLENLLDDKQFMSVKTVAGLHAKLNFLQEKYPEVILESPWKYIASFMGVTPEWLSRVLKKERNSY